MDGPSPSNATINRQTNTLLTILGGLTFVLAVFGTALNSAPNWLPEIWVANGVIIAAALRKKHVSYVLVGLGAELAARLFAGTTIATSLGLCICDACEILVCLFGMRMVHGDVTVDLSRPQMLVTFCLLGMLPAPIVSAAGAAAVLYQSGGPAAAFDLFANWYPPHALGLITTTPFFLRIHSREIRLLFSKARLADTIVAFALLSAVLIASFAQDRYPLLFLGFPALVYVAFRIGFSGIIFAVALIVAAALVALMNDTGPMMLIRGSFAERVLILQLYLGIVTLMGLQVASTLEDGRRMGDALEKARIDSESAKAALSTSENRYRVMAETTTDVITRLSLGSIREYVSPTCKRLFGYEPEEMMGVRPSDFVHPEDRSRVREAARQVIQGEVAERTTVTYRTRHKLGHFVWVEAGINLGRDEAGVPNALICSLRDVTERRAAEAAIEASEARFRLLAENTSELIILGHDDGRLSYVSPASIRLLGYTPTEIAVLKLVDMVHADDVDDLHSTLRRIDDQVGETVKTFRALKKGGGSVWVEGIFRRIPDAIADGPAVVATFRDVSERRAQSLALRDAKTAAEKANQAKTDFLASMSHEIRTPLNSILGFTDLLNEDHLLSKKQRKQIDRIQDAGGALLTIVNDILDFSTIEAGRVQLDRQPFLIYELVDSAISIVQGIAVKKNLDLSTDIAADIPGAFLGDRGRLRQILLNLLNNAVKFTPSGAVTLVVSKVAASDQEMRLRFAVSDTGIGIPQEKRSKLFERFSQVDGSVRRDFGGTGLGLAISKNLVELMGGSIGVDSKPAGGSIFWFEINLSVAKVAITAAWDMTVTENDKRSARILLVEDLEVNRELARAIIESWDHHVDEACDGAEAIEAVKRKPYDLVLMDVQMPGMDGMSATRAIRALDLPCRSVPIIAMTANVLPAQVALFREAGMNDHVGKPISRKDLQAAINRWMTANETRGAPASADPEIIDQDIYRDLLSLIGPAQMDKLLQKLAALLQDRGRLMAVKQRSEVAHSAHAIISAAGSLGFSRLSNLCRTLEEACAGQGALDDLLQGVEVETRRALTTIEDLKSA